MWSASLAPPVVASTSSTPFPAASRCAASTPARPPARPSSATAIISAGVVEVVAEGAEIAEMDEAIEPEAEASASIAAAAAFAASTARPAVSGRGSSAKLPNTAPAAATRQGSKYLRAKR